MYHSLRQHYQPRSDRLPGWLRRLWAWCWCIAEGLSRALISAASPRRGATTIGAPAAQLIERRERHANGRYQGTARRAGDDGHVV